MIYTLKINIKTQNPDLVEIGNLTPAELNMNTLFAREPNISLQIQKPQIKKLLPSEKKIGIDFLIKTSANDTLNEKFKKKFRDHNLNEENEYNLKYVIRNFNKQPQFASFNSRTITQLYQFIDNYENKPFLLFKSQQEQLYYLIKEKLDQLFKWSI